MTIQPGSSHTSPIKHPRHNTLPSQRQTDDDTRSQIYVLSADGSSLFLLDPSKPSGYEQPPPYAPFRITPPPTHLHGTVPPSSMDTESSVGLGISTHHASAGPSSPVGGIVMSDHRPRASTLADASRPYHIDSGTPPRQLVRNAASFSHAPPPALALPGHSHSHSHSTRSTRSLRPSNRRTGSSSRSFQSSPGLAYGTFGGGADERQPLLSPETDWEQLNYPRSRGRWRAIFCGEVEDGEEVQSWSGGWKRYWRTLGSAQCWRGWAHLTFINFPFASHPSPSS